MKAPAVLTNQQQRKEAKERKVTMLFRRNREERDEHDEMQWVGRAAIYLCEDGTEETPLSNRVLSIDEQRALCRETASALGAKVVGEFTDGQSSNPRPGLRQVLWLLSMDPGIHYLIVTSRDRLTTDVDEAFDIGLCLGFNNTVVVTIPREIVPVESATEPSRN
jgi:DNA invertase Pin-like site-specific DNA recombinase